MRRTLSIPQRRGHVESIRCVRGLDWLRDYFIYGQDYPRFPSIDNISYDPKSLPASLQPAPSDDVSCIDFLHHATVQLRRYLTSPQGQATFKDSLQLVTTDPRVARTCPTESARLLSDAEAWLKGYLRPL